MTTPSTISKDIQRQSGGSHPWVPASVAGRCSPMSEMPAGVWGQTVSLFLSLRELSISVALLGK